MSHEARRADSPSRTSPEEEESLVSVLADRVRRMLSVHPRTPIEGLYPAIMREVERTLLATVLDYTKGHREEASTILGLHRNSLRRRLRAVGLEEDPKKQRSASRTTAARSDADSPGGSR